MTKQMTNDEYQDHMDNLAKKVGAALVGARIEEGIIACGACMGFALMQLTPEQQTIMRNHVNALIDDILLRGPRPQ